MVVELHEDLVKKVDGKAREKIAVIGGGITGCLTALFAIRAGYHVTLLEAEGHQSSGLNNPLKMMPYLLGGSTLIGSRLHLGGEYPKDEQTGFDCLEGAMLWPLMWGEHAAHSTRKAADGTLMPRIYTEVKPMTFAVSKASEAAERPEDKLTVEEYERYYEKIREKYAEWFGKIKAAKGWDEETAAARLFGKPDKEIFYKRMTEEELNQEITLPGKNKISLYRNIAGGFHSQEPGLNVPLYLSIIKTLLEKEYQKGNLEIYAGRVEKGDIHALKNGGYQIYCHENTVSPFQVSQMVLAAGGGNPALNPPPSDAPIQAYNRAMLRVKMTDLPDLDPVFVLLNGCMLSTSRYGSDAIIYKTGKDACYLDEKTLTSTDPKLPDSWTKHEPMKQEVNRVAAILRGAGHFFPVLSSRYVEAFELQPLSIGNTLNFQRELTRRRHRPPKEIPWEGATEGGVHEAYATKLTLAPKAAIEVVEQVKARSKMREEGKGGEALSPLESARALEVMLNPEQCKPYSIEQAMEEAGMKMDAEMVKRADRFAAENLYPTTSEQWPSGEAPGAIVQPQGPVANPTHPKGLKGGRS